MRVKKYLLNCFLLLIPIFLWNIFLFDYLPASYRSNIIWQDASKYVGYTENILRAILFGLPVIMILSFKTRIEKIGLALYLIGIVIYFLSWIAMISFYDNVWSKSAFGFMAPAYTTIIWLVGIGLIGNKTFFRIPYMTQIYICFSILFVVIHTYHNYIIFQSL